MKLTATILATLSTMIFGFGLEAEEVPIHQPLPPQAQVEPLVPVESVDGEGDERAQLIRRVESRVRDLERRISSILREHGDELPAVSVGDLPELEDNRRQRNQAWQDLRNHLDRSYGGPRELDPDPLDQPPSVTVVPEEDPEVVEIRLHNRMRIAQCAFELHVVDQGTGDSLRKTEEIVDALDPMQLMPSLRPEWFFLRVAVVVERARLAKAAQERDAYLAEAEQRLSVFAAEYPGHMRVANATLLIEQVRLNDRVREVRRESGL